MTQTTRKTLINLGGVLIQASACVFVGAGIVTVVYFVYAMLTWPG